MPTRPYSAAILGGLWATTSADTWSDVADALRLKATESQNEADTVRSAGDQLLAEQSGELIACRHERFVRTAIAVQDQADLYFSMARVVSECAQLIYHSQTQLDAIDRKA